MVGNDLAGRKVFKVFNQEFVVDERYNVTKELGQGAYGIVWLDTLEFLYMARLFIDMLPQRGYERSDRGGGCYKEGHQCFQQEDSGQESA
jgi:hypothetical protein